MQILQLKHGQDILNMRFKIDVAIREMHAFAESGQGRREHLGSTTPERPREP